MRLFPTYFDCKIDSNSDVSSPLLKSNVNTFCETNFEHKSCLLQLKFHCAWKKSFFPTGFVERLDSMWFVDNSTFVAESWYSDFLKTNQIFSLNYLQISNFWKNWWKVWETQRKKQWIWRQINGLYFFILCTTHMYTQKSFGRTQSFVPPAWQCAFCWPVLFFGPVFLYQWITLFSSITGRTHNRVCLETQADHHFQAPLVYILVCLFICYIYWTFVNPCRGDIIFLCKKWPLFPPAS